MRKRCDSSGRNKPAGERRGAFYIELVAILEQAAAVAPLVDTVLEMGIQDPHGWPND